MLIPLDNMTLDVKEALIHGMPCLKALQSQLSPAIILMSGVAHDCGTHLSPGVTLIYDLAYDSGMLQSSLFTSRSQNQVSGKLRKSGFWS